MPLALQRRPATTGLWYTDTTATKPDPGLEAFAAILGRVVASSAYPSPHDQQRPKNKQLLSQGSSRAGRERRERFCRCATTATVFLRKADWCVCVGGGGVDRLVLWLGLESRLSLIRACS